MNAVALEKELTADLEKFSDENVVEAYITAILNLCDKNRKKLEKELLKRKLFLVALERYDIQKTLGRLDSHFF
ncbi:hypothetical protein [Neobacillus cucumis]|uniref:Uncharacterized protein n=1 Tax=Neobacillus cucumis TaxID=1740721 RepID=A0A2N5HNH7_9BACI|nr:hypothetical protein [Neobacillus cucumis]PLS07085.1 hypothetical protein CVD27_05220 [Neobacillus cucumis]